MSTFINLKWNVSIELKFFKNYSISIYWLYDGKSQFYEIQIKPDDILIKIRWIYATLSRNLVESLFCCKIIIASK